MFGRKKTKEKRSYDRKNQEPVLRCSICNGEQVAGFRDIHSGKFTEVMLIRNPGELEEFAAMYDIKDVSEIRKEY